MSTNQLPHSLLVLEQILNQDVLKIVKSFPELPNALNDQLSLTKRLILEPTLPTLIGSELWRGLVSSAYIQSSELKQQIRIMPVLRNVLEVQGVSELVEDTQEYSSVLCANRSLALAISQNQKCVSLTEENLRTLLVSLASGTNQSSDREEFRRPVLRVAEPGGETVSEGSRKSVDRLSILHDLAIRYIYERQYEVAIPLCRQTLEELRTIKGEENLDVAKMLIVLGLAYRDQEKFKMSAELLTEALAIRTKLLGENHADVASTLNNLGVLYSMWRKYKEAEIQFKKALGIKEKIYGKDHPEVASQLTNFAFLYRNEGRYRNGVAYCQEALEVLERCLSREEPGMVKEAFVLLKKGKNKDAGNLLKQLLDLAQGKGLNDTNDLSQQLRRSLELKNDNSVIETRVIQKPERDTKNQNSTVDSSTIKKALKTLAALYYRQRKYEAARTIEALCLK